MLSKKMNNLFLKTRLKLTGLYILIIVIILLIFSQIIYLSVSNNIANNVEGNFTSKKQQDAFIQKENGNLFATIVFANAIVLIIIGLTSYFLAGKTLNPVENTLKQQKQFLSDASHELRTPLSILQTNLDNALKEKKIQPRESKNILDNLEEVGRMTALVNDLLLLSRLDVNNSSVSLKKVDLNGLLQNTEERFSSYAKSKKISLFLSSNPSRIFVNGNQELLSRALGNVIKNAIDYNRKNGKVFLSIKENKYAIVVVKDTGLGIPPKNLPYIFNRFYKAEESRSEHKGTGLGLAIAREIIEKHKGRVKIDSVLNKGTNVRIILPVI